MFTLISENHPSDPIHNLSLKPYDFCDAEWIPESSHDDNEFSMQMSHKCDFIDWLKIQNRAVKSLHGLVSVIY